MKRIGKDGRRHNVGSEHRWATWQVPPVICPGCGQRVTLKQAFDGSSVHGTYHARPECLPYRVELQVELAKP